MNEEQPQTPQEQTEEKQTAWNTVTPLSRILALILFIALPFVGFWLGYKYAPVKVVEVERVVEVEKVVEQENKHMPEKVSATNIDISDSDFSLGWKKYINEEIGYEISFPSEANLIIEDNKTIFSFGYRDDVPEGGRSMIIMLENITLDEFIKRNNVAEYEKIIKQEEFTIGELNAIKLTQSTAIGLEITYMFIQKNNLAIVIEYSDYDALHKQVVSSFKFLN